MYPKYKGSFFFLNKLGAALSSCVDKHLVI